MIVTPDRETYVEDFANRIEIAEVRYRPRLGVLPEGLPAGAAVFAFQDEIDRDLGRDWLAEGRAAAAVERRRRRLPELGLAELPAMVAPVVDAAAGATVVAG